jgi:hypothetical protein
MLRIVVPALAVLIVAPKAILYLKSRLRGGDDGRSCCGWASSNATCSNCDSAREEGAEKYKQMDERVIAVETELAAIKSALHRQSQLLARLVHTLAAKEGKHVETGEETRSDADYVDLDGKLSRFSAFEFTTWTPAQTVAWVEKVLGTDACSGLFADVDGHMLYGMIFEHDHGLSFADKCFFMGVDRESCVVLEKAAGDMAK